MGMYEVCVKCGHVGRNYYVDKILAVEACNGKEAAAKARELPRVKHDHKDAIRYVESIDAERFAEIASQNLLDPFFVCHNVQEQRRMCGSDIEKHRDTEVKYYRRERNEKRQNRPKKKIRRFSRAELIYSYYNEVMFIC